MSRRNLRRDFKGYLAVVYAPHTTLHKTGVEVYRVTSWTTKDWDLIINLAPLSAKAEPVYLKGKVDSFFLNTEVGGTNGEWKLKLRLQLEDRINIANEETKKKIEETEKK